MIARSLTFLLAVGAAVAYRPYDDVDPHTVSCDPQGEVFLLLPHFEDCSKFYMCVHGNEVEFDCPPGTIFDFGGQHCNWAWASTCQLRQKEEDSEGSGESETYEPDVEGSGASEEEWSDKPDKYNMGVLNILSAAGGLRPRPVQTHEFHPILNCQDPGSAAKQLQYRGDCQRYWRCYNGVPQAEFCSDGLFFNARTQQCDFEANSKCVDDQPNELAGEFIEYK